MLLQTVTNHTHKQRVGQRPSDTVDHRGTLRSTGSEGNYTTTYPVPTLTEVHQEVTVAFPHVLGHCEDAGQVVVLRRVLLLHMYTQTYIHTYVHIHTYVRKFKETFRVNKYIK